MAENGHVESNKKWKPSRDPFGIFIAWRKRGHKASKLEMWPRSKLLKIYEDAGYALVREETFLPMDNISFLK